MSSNKNIYEVFDDFRNQTTKEGRINVLQSNNTFALRSVLQGAMHPDIKFTIKKIPTYKPEPVPVGLAYNHISDALSRVYLFMENNSRRPAALTEKRESELLIQILESMEKRESEVYANMLLKNLKIPHLTPKLVNEAFKGLLPE